MGISLLTILFCLGISCIGLAEDMTGKSSIGVDISSFSCEGWKENVDDWDPKGIMIEATYKYFINENLALGGSIGRWSDDDKYRESVDGYDYYWGTFYTDTYTSDRTITIIPIMFNVTYFFDTADSKMKPYIEGGLGLFNAKVEWDEEGRIWDSWYGVYDTYSLSTSDSAQPIGLRLGGGIEFEISPRVSINGDLRYQILSIDFDYSYDDFDVDGLIIGAGINLLF